MNNSRGISLSAFLKSLLWLGLGLPLALVFPPVILFPYRENRRKLLFVVVVLLIAGLIFFHRSVGWGLIIYWAAGLFGFACKAISLVRSSHERQMQLSAS